MNSTLENGRQNAILELDNNVACTRSSVLWVLNSRWPEVRWEAVSGNGLGVGVGEPSNEVLRPWL